MNEIYMVFIGILGLVLGSFYGVVIDRLPANRNIATGRSECDNCHHELGALDLVPIFSFLIQKGRCRYCKTKLSWRYPLLEVLTSLTFLLSFMRFGLTLQTALACALASILIIITFIDIDTMIINDRFHVLIFLLGLIQLFILEGNFISSLVGTVIVSVPLLIIALITKGMGGGDIKLMASSGFLLGATNIVVAFFIGVIIGGLYGIFALALKSKGLKSEIPFGPYLCFGIFCAYLIGTELVSMYLSLFIR